MLNQLKNFGEKMSMVVRALTLGETLKNLDFLYYLYDQLPTMLLNHRIEWEQEKTVDRVQLQELAAGRLPPGSIGVRPILRTTAEAEGQRLNYLAIIARDLIAGARERDMRVRRAEHQFDKMFGEKKNVEKLPELVKFSVPAGQFFNIETNGVMTKDEAAAMAEKIFPSGEQSPPYVQVTPPVSAEPATGESPAFHITKEDGVLVPLPLPFPLQDALSVVPDGLCEELTGGGEGKIHPDPIECAIIMAGEQQ